MTNINAIRWTPRLLVGTLVLAAVMALPPTAELAAQSNNAAGGLVGAWLVEVTLRDCSTGAALGPAFRTLVSFHRGGTVTETPALSGFAVGQRSPGHGDWQHAGGSTYRQRLVALIAFDTPPNPPSSPGFLAGWMTVTTTLTMTDNDNYSSTTGTNTFYNLNGEPYRTGCSSAIGRRF